MPDSPNLVALFYRRAVEKGSAPFLWRKRSGAWTSVSWAEAAAQVSSLASALAELGIEPGDRVGLICESRPEWPIADLAIMAVRAISVPAYITNGVADHRHLLTDSGAKAIILSNAGLAEKILPAAKDAGSVRFAIAMEAVDAGDSKIAIHLWDDLLDRYDGSTAPEAESIGSDETACLIYTSGTGGAPKGVMLSHAAILCNCRGATAILRPLGLDDEVFLSFLPLSHSYEHTAGLYFPIMIGAQIYYAEGIDKLAQNMIEVRPTLMTAVPRLYESMHDRIRRGIKQTGGKTERLFDKTVALGRKNYEAPGSLSVTERITNLILDTLVRRKVRGRFGGRLKALVSGGAPLDYEIGSFFTALGIRLLQGYGQTESAPIISCNPPWRNKIATVGIPLEGVEVRIADDGEILVRGDLVMQGYWNRPKETAATIIDDWLYTGDIGEFDPNGHLRITDRKKDIIVNSGGDNISPQRVEGMLNAQMEIGQSMVQGDKRPHLVALIVPDETFAKSWATENSRTDASLAMLIEDVGFRKEISAAIDRVNEKLSVIERVRRFTMTAENFTIDNAMMTPTLKIRRHVIREGYGAALEKLYGG
jgi:long-chain acyl-CoA synthetase